MGKRERGSLKAWLTRSQGRTGLRKNFTLVSCSFYAGVNSNREREEADFFFLYLQCLSILTEWSTSRTNIIEPQPLSVSPS